MKKELLWLTYTIVLTALLWVPYILNRLREMGIWTAVANSNADNTPKALWAKRLMKAHKNAVENLVIFAPLVLALQIVGVSTAMTVTACIVYFFARLTHCVVYTAGIPFVRTLAFAVGVVCQMTLAIALLKAL